MYDVDGPSLDQSSIAANEFESGLCIGRRSGKERRALRVPCVSGYCYRHFQYVFVGVKKQSCEADSSITVIAIPTIIVRKIRLCMRRKAALASCLCLSSVTVLVTIIRVSGIVATGTQSIDVIWQIYWQYVEASVAVVMASASALRSLFVTARGPRASGWHPRSASSGRSMRRMKMLPWKTRRRSRMAQHLRQPLDEDAPPIPRAHIIGSSEFFRTFSTDDIDFFDLIPGRHNPLSTRSLGSVPGYATTVSDTPSQMV